MDIAGTNVNQAKYKKDHDKICPSCNQCLETTAHVLTCNEAGRVDVLRQTVRLMDKWMQSNQTDPDLCDYITQYALGRGRGNRIHKLRIGCLTLYLTNLIAL